MPRVMTDMGWATVLAFDPGGTTGWAVMAAKPKDLLDTRRSVNHKMFQHVASGQIIGSELAQVDQLVELVDMWPDAAVVSESFVQRIRNTGLETDPAYSPVRINAVLKWWLATEDRFLYKQAPDMAKRTWTDERLNKAKLEPGGGHKNRHARDGMRHAATFMGRARDQVKLRSSAWPKLFGE